MNAKTPDRSATSTSKAQPDTNFVADDTGRAIVALLHKAVEMAKDDCARAMGLAHKLALQLRAAEERVTELEAEAAHPRSRHARGRVAAAHP
jgi:hypothetical protein